MKSVLINTVNSCLRKDSYCGKDAPMLIDYLAHPDMDRKLKDYYGVSTEKELLDILGADFYYLSCRDISQNESLASIYKGPELAAENGNRTCPFGITWKRGAYQSKFAVDEAIKSPLKDAQSEKEILEYNWPQTRFFDFDAFGEEIQKNSERIIIGGFWSGILGDSYRMLGFENFLLKIATNPQLIKALVKRMTRFYLELNAALFDVFGDQIDIWFFWAMILGLRRDYCLALRC